jgi:hypothetical protein
MLTPEVVSCSSKHAAMPSFCDERREQRYSDIIHGPINSRKELAGALQVPEDDAAAAASFVRCWNSGGAHQPGNYTRSKANHGFHTADKEHEH